MDYLRERRGRQKLHPGVIVSSQDREHLPHGNEAIQWKWTSDASIGPEGNLTRCVPLPRLPLPLEKSPDAEGNCCLFWRTQLGLKEGFTVFQNTANTLKQLFGSGQVILGVSKPQLFNFKMDCFTAAESCQSCPTLCDPLDASPPGSRPWDSPGKNTGVHCHFLLQCMKVKRESSRSVVSDSSRPHAL